MALKLILVRHAKSAWSASDLSDHDRPLNKRGRDSAQALGNWIRTQKLIPDQILCSSSVRTQETCRLMDLGTAPDIRPALYHTSADTMLGELRTAQGKKVMMIGHNPGIAELAERLARDLPSHPRFLDYPTGATTVFKFPAERWQDVTFGLGKVKMFVIPRELT